MTTLGQLSLLVAFIASGYAAVVCMAGGETASPGSVRQLRVRRSGVLAAVTAFAALSVVAGLLAYALLVKDFRFQYVAAYSNPLLPWYYSLSAFWVGQAGSLLLWAWSLGVVAMAYRFWPRRTVSGLREPAFGALLAYLCFLTAVMAFAADPMETNLSLSDHGEGLVPTLQHPAMLIHPPIVFFGYAIWAVPFALAVAALAKGRADLDWVRQARPWALLAWLVLGVGILLGALWAYEELGWGGYWNWDPVENGSLMPWLTGTALIHCLLAWQHRGVLKKTTFLLTIITFGLCNFATFLTRSGIFSSLHAFSQSPIGWMFLLLMVVLASGGIALLWARRAVLAAERPISAISSRESVALISMLALVGLALIMFLGTVSVPLSGAITGRKITVGGAYYNCVLIPVGLVLAAGVAAAPLLRWGAAPGLAQRWCLLAAAGAGAIAPAIAWPLGIRNLLALGITWLVAAAVLALAASLVLDAYRCRPGNPVVCLLRAATVNRRRYAGWLMHLGFLCIILGVTGSSLGTQRNEVTLREGQSLQWAGRTVRFARLVQRDSPGKFTVEAELEISGAAAPYRLLPARHLYRPQHEWVSEVAIHSTWAGDFYTILTGNEGPEGVRFTLVVNPMMRWLWASGWVCLLAAVVALWPARRPSPRRPAVPAPKFLARRSSSRSPHAPRRPLQ